MTPAFLVMLLVVLPCALLLGYLWGWQRGRDEAERNFAAAFHVEARRTIHDA